MPADAAPHGTELDAHLERLLARSLICWRVAGRVGRDRAGAPITVDALGRRLVVERAAPGLPFRWMVTVDGRQRPAVSVLAVVRQVRLALDPAYAKMRVRIAPMALLPP